MYKNTAIRHWESDLNDSKRRGTHSRFPASKMKYLLLLSLIASAALANAATVTKNCDGALPVHVCARLTSLEAMITNLARRSTSMVARVVQLSAEKNARLFANTMALINATRATRPIDPTKLTKIMQDLQKMLEEAEKARDEASQAALTSIQEASMKILGLIQRIIAEAANGTRKDVGKLQRHLKEALRSAHKEIREDTFEAIRKVQEGNRKVEQFAIKILSMLGYSQVSMAQSFVDVMSMEENINIADDGEHEIEADFDATANKAYELITLSDSGIAKRGIFQNWWDKIKQKLVALKDIVVAEIKNAVAIIWPQIKEKLTEIVQIIINTAKQAIVNIAGQMVLVTVPPS